MNRNQTKLLLIMPPQVNLINGFATGLISLSNYVTTKMPEVCTEILDLSTCTPQEARTQINASCADLRNQRLITGITTTTAGYQSSLLIAEIIKDAYPHAIVVLGGHHASADAETVLSCHSDIIDLIIIGEGERSLCDLIRYYPTLDAVPGAAFLRDGMFTRTAIPAPLTPDELDSIPITYGTNGLIGTPGKFDHVTYVSARGCPLGCAFCAVGRNPIRAKSIGAVARDIEVLLDLGFSRIAIEDNFFAHSSYRTEDLCNVLADIKRRRNGAFAWDCQTRVESLARKDTIALMAKAGCEAVYIGVESVHPEHLVYLNKTKNPTKYIRCLVDEVVPALLDTNIDCYINLQFGLPGESVEHESNTLEVIEFLGGLAASRGKVITVFPQLHVVYPGTAHYYQGVVEKRFPVGVFESFTKWELQQLPVVFWLREHFAHGAGGIPEGILEPTLLREGRYDIDKDAVFRISAAIRSMDRLSGVMTFHYGSYIIKNATLPNENVVRNTLVVNH